MIFLKRDKIFCFTALIFIAFNGLAQNVYQYPFQDPKLDMEKRIDNHYCPTKIGFKNSVTLNSQRLQVKKSLFQNRG